MPGKSLRHKNWVAATTLPPHEIKDLSCLSYPLLFTRLIVSSMVFGYLIPWLGIIPQANNPRYVNFRDSLKGSLALRESNWSAY